VDDVMSQFSESDPAASVLNSLIPRSDNGAPDGDREDNESPVPIGDELDRLLDVLATEVLGSR
jgi:hypothetical protein